MSIRALFRRDEPEHFDEDFVFPEGAQNLYPDDWVSQQQIQQLAARVVRLEKYLKIYQYSQGIHNDPHA